MESLQGSGGIPGQVGDLEGSLAGRGCTSKAGLIAGKPSHCQACVGGDQKHSKDRKHPPLTASTSAFLPSCLSLQHPAWEESTGSNLGPGKAREQQGWDVQLRPAANISGSHSELITRDFLERCSQCSCALQELQGRVQINLKDKLNAFSYFKF